MREVQIALRWRLATEKDKFGAVLVDGNLMVLQEAHGVPQAEGYGVYMEFSQYHDVLPELKD